VTNASNSTQPVAGAVVLADQSGDPFGPPTASGSSPGSSGSDTTVGSTGAPNMAIFPPLRRCVRTDSNGNYGMPLLSPGTYVVTALALDFLDSSQNATVTVGQPTTANFQLTPGNVTVSNATINSPVANSLGALLGPLLNNL